MDIFRMGSSADLATPVGILIKSGTDPLLIGPDWTKNMQICDTIGSSREVAEQAIKALKRRLQETDENVVHLALIIAETCMKNCDESFAFTAHQKSFLDELNNIARNHRGAKNAEEALRIIQQWGRRFETSNREALPFYFDNFMAMKSKGFLFPQEPESAFNPIDDAPARSATRSPPISSPSQTRTHASGSSSSSAPAPVVQQQPEVDGVAKLQHDLEEVMEKVYLCREIMQNSPGIQHDELLAGVVGFLEACRDRLPDLIDVGAQGGLSEEQFEFALKVNDAVCKTLDAERNGTNIAVRDEDSPTKRPAGQEKNLLDLGDDDEDGEDHANRSVRKAAATSSPSRREGNFKPKAPASGSSSSAAAAPAADIDLLAPYVPPPAPLVEATPLPPPVPVATAAPVSNFDLQQLPVQPVQAPAVTAPPASASSLSSPVPATVTGPVDDLDALLADTSVAPAPPSSSTANPNKDAAAEFDAFFESLNKQGNNI